MGQTLPGLPGWHLRGDYVQRARYFGLAKVLGMLFWLRRPGAQYFGRGKTLGGLFGLRKKLGGRNFGCGKNHVRAHILEI